MMWIFGVVLIVLVGLIELVMISEVMIELVICFIVGFDRMLCEIQVCIFDVLVCIKCLVVLYSVLVVL